MAGGHDMSGACWFTVIMRDVTDRENVQATLLAAKEQAEKAAQLAADLRRAIQLSHSELMAANDRLQKFISIVAYDLRASLNGADAFADLLRQDYAPCFDEDGFDLLHRIEKSVRRMKEMLSALLGNCRCSRPILLNESVSLQSIFDETVASFNLEAIGADVRLALADGAERVAGDATLIGHVFQNVVSNAIKFRRDTALLIEVAAVKRGAMVEISVADNGIGIEPEFREKVFDMFYRLHDEEKYAGTGIGLTVCQKIVHDHGGTIWIDPEHPGGTRVVFHLAAAQDSDGVMLEME